MQGITAQTTMDRLRATVTSNWFYLALLALLIITPHAIGWFSGEGPFGTQVGRRFMVIGESVTWQGRLSQIFIFAILAMSYNLIFGFTGVISFGHALFFGIGGYMLGAMLRIDDFDSGLAMLLGVIGGLIIAGIASFIIGLVSLRLKGVYFAVFTLAVAEAVFIYFTRYGPTGAEDGFTFSEMPEVLEPTRNPLNFYYLSLAGAVLTFLFIRRLMYSPTGAIMLAIRENEDRAKSIGYNTLRYKIFSITIGGMIASFSGMLHVILNSKRVGPEMMGVNFTVEPLLMTIIGGIGTFLGPVIGAAGLRISETLLRDLIITIGDNEINIGDSWEVILGVLFILVVIIFPFGVVGTWTRWRASKQTQRMTEVINNSQIATSGD